MNDAQRKALVQGRVAELLSGMSGVWTLAGDLVRGPGTTAVAMRDHPGTSVAHVDLGFVLNVDRDDAPVIWDCASGFGSDEAAVVQAVDIWARTTAPVVLELLNQRGEHAEHIRGDDPMGLPGWHAIHGPVLGWGVGDAPNVLQKWALDHPLLPQVASTLRTQLDRPELNGVKFFFGSSRHTPTAEIRINGQADTTVSETLLSLPWPRFEEPAYVRAFVLLIHSGDSA